METSKAFLLEKLFLINDSLQKAKSQEDCVTAANTCSTNISIIYQPPKALSAPAVKQAESYLQNCFDTQLLSSQIEFSRILPGSATRTGETCRRVYKLSTNQRTEAACANHWSCWHTLNLLTNSCENILFFQIWKKRTTALFFPHIVPETVIWPFWGMVQKMGEIMGPLKQWINAGNGNRT